MHSPHTRPLFFREFERIDRLEWIITLRWAAILFIFSITFVAEKIFSLQMESTWIYAIVFIIIIYNYLLLLCIRKLKTKDRELRLISHQLSFVQGMLDLFFLTLVLHFSGGIENPFIFFYLFHIIIASLLMDRKHTYILAFFSSLLIFTMSLLEYSHIIPHHAITGFFTVPVYSNYLYLISINLVFSSTIIISAFITTSINETIVNKEKELKTAWDRLEVANTSLREQDRLKSEYVMLVSHDLKSPLSSISSLVDILTGEHVGKQDKRTLNILDRISKRIEGMMLFINDLLNLSKINSGETVRDDTIEIADIINEAASEIMAEAVLKRISVKKEFEENLPLIKGDKNELRNLFSNLFSNAVKYNKKNGHILINAKRDGNNIRVGVTDSGIGIHRDDIDSIFNEFYRAGNARKHFYEGTGLGLSLVKSVVERHGGKIEVESSQGGDQGGEGSTFVVMLPVG